MIETREVIALIAMATIKIIIKVITKITVGALGLVANLDECESMLDMKKKGRQSSVLWSLKKYDDTEEEVRYLRLRVLDRYQPHTRFTALKTN